MSDEEEALTEIERGELLPVQTSEQVISTFLEWVNQEGAAEVVEEIDQEFDIEFSTEHERLIEKVSEGLGMDFESEKAEIKQELLEAGQNEIITIICKRIAVSIRDNLFPENDSSEMLDALELVIKLRFLTSDPMDIGTLRENFVTKQVEIEEGDVIQIRAQILACIPDEEPLQ